MPEPINSETPKEDERHRSTVQFPYGSLNDGIAVARAIFANGGQQGMSDQVAAWMNTIPTNGTFRMQVATSRKFGLITVGREFISLTSLGNKIQDAATEADARARAFLTVELYTRLFDIYRGKLLPPDAALESEIEKLGVSPKQADKARQAFQRSAEQAGFFARGRDRLVLPAGVSFSSAQEPPPPLVPPPETPQKPPGPPSNPSDDLHPFIRGLLDTLPAPRSSWPKDKREQWLEAAKNIFTLIYDE